MELESIFSYQTFLRTLIVIEASGDLLVFNAPRNADWLFCLSLSCNTVMGIVINANRNALLVA